jgi:hypothetical protein
MHIMKTVNSHSHILLYPIGTDHAQKKSPSIVAWRRSHRKLVSRVRLRVHWSVTSTGSGADDIEYTASSIVACWAVLTQLFPANALIKSVTIKQTNSMALVRKRSIPTERPQLVGEVSANICGYKVSRGQRNGFPRPYSRFSRPGAATISSK